jgi:hypothetical protein
VAVAPTQIAGELTVVTGNGLTVTVATAVPEHPPVVAVTVYEVVTAGETFNALVVDPVFQTYVVPPVAVNVAVAPAQIVGELTVEVIAPPTVTVAIAVDVQVKDVPVTV